MRELRYLVVLPQAPAARLHWEGRLDRLIASVEGAFWALKSEGILAIVLGQPARVLCGEALVIGSLFGREAEPDFDSPLNPSGLCRRLAEHGWGGYVAVCTDAAGERVSVLRAPMGHLPCYWTRYDHAVVFASDLRLMRAAGLPQPQLDADALARYLAIEDLRTAETCLATIAELRGGECLTFANGEATHKTLWSPWTFASREFEIVDRAAAETTVREAALACVAALAKDHESIVLKLSGGIDSSIVAACLKVMGQSFAAVNLVTADASGDERTYARLVGRALEINVAERFREVERVSLERSAAAHLPRPLARSFTQETSRICADVARETDSTAIFDGGGGDNVFCSLQSARPAADCLLTQPGLAPFWSTAASIADLAQVSLLKVASRAAAIAMRRSPAYAWDLDLRFLSDGARPAIACAKPHPWLSPPAGALPGKAAHIAILAAAQGVVEGFDAEDPLPTYSPLLAQPLVEACLRVPSWLWFEDGRNRSAARRAFAGYLPRRILERRSKGAPDCFIAELFEANRLKIKGMLMDGELMRLGLLDRRAIDVALSDEAPVKGHDFLRLMRLADAEAWARCWR
jgi:asparagine synthase (glutamine-hydrolysing)